MVKTLYSRRQEILRETLVDLRKSAELNQRQLAKALGRERGLISRLEGGQRRLDIVEFFEVCEVCGVDPVKAAAKLMRRFRLSAKK